MKKIHSRSGETLVESLVAILVLALLSVFLMTAIGTATKINAGLKTDSSSFRYEDRSEGTSVNMTVKDTESGSTYETSMQKHEVNGYVYYD